MTSLHFIVLFPWLLLSVALFAACSVITITRWLRRAKVPRAWTVRR